MSRCKGKEFYFHFGLFFKKKEKKIIVVVESQPSRMNLRCFAKRSLSKDLVNMSATLSSLLILTRSIRRPLMYSQVLKKRMAM